MKQVININFHGRVVPIEVTAFEILKGYTESLNRYFENEEGKEEIINDIESRVGELFQERLKAGETCITDDDVNAIIRSMGRPEDFETEEAMPGAAEKARGSYTETQAAPAPEIPKRLYRDENNKVIGGVCSGLANYFGIDVVVVRIIFVVLGISFGFGLITYLVLWIAVPSTATTVIGSLRKKLYRDGDDKIIGGVCSGIGNYFGVNAWIPRILFLLPFLSFVARWGRWNGGDFPDLVRVGFSPGALIIYIILWLVIPEAFSTTEKLEMKGEKVDVNSIKNSVVEEMKGVQQRAEKFTKEAKTFAQEKGKTFTSEVGSAARRGSRSLGDIIVFIFKLFAYFVLGCIGLAVIVGLFGLGIFAIGVFPMKDFILREGWQNVFAWGTLIFFITVPIIGMITWLVRKLAKIKRNSKTMRLSFIALWIIGWFCFISLIASISMDFRTSNKPHEQPITLINPSVNKLIVTSESPDQNFYRDHWFRMEPFEGIDEDTAMLRNMSVHIFKSTNDSFKVTMLKMVDGPSREDAERSAAMIKFNVAQRDTLLITDEGIAITRKEKFRNQRIELMIFVPVGKTIRVADNIGWGGDVSFGWNGNHRNLEFRGEEEGWQHERDYIMRENGLYDLKGRPAATWKHPEYNDEDNEDGPAPDENKTNDSNGYRYRDNKAGTIPVDSLIKEKSEKDQQKQKDSLTKEKNKTVKNQVNAGDRISGEQLNQTYSYILPAYNPLLIMN